MNLDLLGNHRDFPQYVYLSLCITTCIFVLYIPFIIALLGTYTYVKRSVYSQGDFSAAEN